MTKEYFEQLAAELRKYGTTKGCVIGRHMGIMDNAADAIEELLEKAEVQANIIRVETPLGALIARPSYGEPDYPGIFIDLRRTDADQDCLLALIEYTDSEGDVEGGNIISRVFGDSIEDEYTDRIVHTNIEEFFRTE